MKERLLKIGIFIFPGDSPQVGGGYSYIGQLIKAIDNYDFDARLYITFVSIQPINKPLEKDTIYLKPLEKFSKKGFFLKFIRKILKYNYILNFINKAFLNKEISRIEQLSFVKQLKKEAIDLLFYPKPGIVINNFPYILTNWDIGHRTMYPFPEVAMDGTFESRERFYCNDVRKAFLLITESEQGKKELIEFYGIPPNRIKILPMFPGPVVNLNLSKEITEQIFNQLGITSSFFFYPAQFWAHKNHYNLIKAFTIVKQKFPDFKLVFTGSDKGNLDYIVSIIRDAELSNDIVYLGFVTNEVLYTLYKKATALVMPTLLGPTNMPLLEAQALGCRVLCSDLVGHRELMGESCMYFNPLSPEDIAEKMIECAVILPNQGLPGIVDLQGEPSVGVLEEAFLELLPIRLMF